MDAVQERNSDAGPQAATFRGMGGIHLTPEEAEFLREEAQDLTRRIAEVQRLVSGEWREEVLCKIRAHRQSSASLSSGTVAQTEETQEASCSPGAGKQEIPVPGARHFGRVKGVEHHIPTGDHPPIKERYRPVPPAHYQHAKGMLRDMKEAGVIRDSCSPWAAPLVLVKKKDNTMRMCVDYRKVNRITHKDAYPLPRIEESLAALKSANFFSTLDLTSGYWQVPVAEADREKTAFTTPMGLSEFNCMPFGLCNAPGTFQRLMECCLGHRNFETVLLYLDDVIVYSKTYEDHLKHLAEVFKALANYGLKVKPSKCHLLKPKVQYLGHVVSADGVAPDPDKITVIKDWPRPSSIKEVRQFLGLVGYYRRFIPGFTKMAAPMQDLLIGQSRKAKNQKPPFRWEKLEEESFCQLKMALTGDEILAYPDYSQPFILHTDASNIGLGAVLSHIQQGKERVIAYASRKLRPTERNPENYSSFKLEFLAVVWAVTERFKHYLASSKFTVYTDNNPLTHLDTARLAALEQRWMARLSNFEFTIKYRAGRSNANADLQPEVALNALEGDARKVVLLKSEDRRKTVVDIIRILEKAFDHVAAAGQLRVQFFARTQRDGESLIQYAIALMELHQEIKKKSPVTVGTEAYVNSILRDQFIEGIRSEALRSELLKARNTPGVTYACSGVNWDSSNPMISIILLPIHSGVGGFFSCRLHRQGPGGTFQRLMEYCLGDYNFESVLIYLDDVIIFGDSFDDHLKKLRQVLHRLRDNGLKIKPKKCHLFQTQIEYLGHVVSAEGVQPAPSKIEAIQGWPRPKTVREVRAFLGLAGYYRRFVKDFAKVAEPLNELLRGTAQGPKNQPIRWTDRQQQAFDWVRAALVQAPLLAYARFDQPFTLYTDGSLHGLGAVLAQEQDGHERVIAYASRSLRDTERNPDNYSSLKLEMLALVWAMTEKFSEYLAGSEILVMTDNNALAHLENAKLGALEIHSDQGACFQGQLITELLQVYGIQQSRTTPYHPQGNGACERFNRTLLQMLRTLEQRQKERWTEFLPELMWAYNNRVHSTTGFTPYAMMFGRPGREIEELSLTVPNEPKYRTAIAPSNVECDCWDDFGVRPSDVQSPIAQVPGVPDTVPDVTVPLDAVDPPPSSAGTGLRRSERSTAGVPPIRYNPEEYVLHMSGMKPFVGTPNLFGSQEDTEGEKKKNTTLKKTFICI
ncbi:uncharacterized protein [Phyllobates terribilis]|uniref:uncharacterized protein n=1 Tax=Phyllobates terribilis TaxID=111132 RepID=UPI003CCB23FB